MVDLISYRGRREILFTFFVGFLIVWLWTGNVPAAEIHLAWDKNSEPQVTGYKIYYGFSSRQYDHVEDAGNVTQYVLKELAPGRYYIAAKAYDGFGNMSDYSEELIVDLTEKSDTLQVPVASDVLITTLEDVPANGRFNCQTPNGTAMTFVIASPPTKGTVTITDPAIGSFRYDPYPDANGEDLFTYKATSNNVVSNIASVLINITPVNDAPVSKGGAYVTTEDRSLQGSLDAVDADRDSLLFTVVDKPKLGSVLLTNDKTGAFTYKPNPDVSGKDSFTFKASDKLGDSNLSVISVTINPQNDPPWVQDMTLSTLENKPVSGKLSAGDVEGSPLSYILTNQAAKGKVTFSDVQGEFTYAPFAGSTGQDSFSFQVSDGDLLSDTATVTVDLLPRVDILLEAEDGDVQAPLEVSLHPSASGGASVQIPSGAVESIPLEETAGKAEYIFEAPASGRYYIWAKVLTPSTQEKALFVSVDDMAPVPWEPAMGGPENWIWDSLSERTGGIPKEIYLEAGVHRLTLRPGQSDLGVDQILITNDPEPFSGMMILEDAEDGKSDGWQPLDGTGARGDLTNQFDGERGSRIIHLDTEPLAQFYSLPVKGGLDAKNADLQVLQWSMKSEQDLLVGFTVETSSGDYQVIYWPRGNGFFRHYYKLIYIGLGESLSDGTWHSFVRNIQQDVSSVDPGINILRFKSFLVTGKGNVDDIRLR